MKTFWIRTASAAVYAVLFLGSILSGRLFGEGIGISILTAFALFVAEGCAFEYYRMADKMCHQPNKAVGYIFVACVTVFLGLAALNPAWFFCAAVLLLLTLPVTLLLQLWHHSEQPFSDALHTLLPVLYCAIPLGLMPTLHDTFNILIMCIVMVWVNDSFAYMGGSLVGKHKMWPRHSPGKTWEGTAIGVIACVLVGAFFGPMFQSDFIDGRIPWIILGVICGVIGTLGDLVESMLKRSCGVKDSGNIMPGHGGFLDRFDSLLMIIPFAAILALFTLLV